MTLLSAAPPELLDGAALDGAEPRRFLEAPEGAYVNLSAAAGQPALILGAPGATTPIAVVLALDDLFEDRLEAALRLWKAMVGRSRVKKADYTVQRRRRLKLVLRSLDGDLSGESYRAIAVGLFGDRIPEGAAWRTHSRRSQTIRLVQDGRGLMKEGYLRLLRNERRGG